MSIDPTKYMTGAQVARLRDFWRQRAVQGLESGRMNAVKTWMIVDFALATGLRSCEIASIRPKAILWDLPAIAVRRAKKRKEQPPDILPIGNNLKKHLAEYLKGRDGLFMSIRGKPLTVRGIAQQWKYAVLGADLPERYAHIHVARDTFATHYYAKTHDLAGLQRILGHESPETTANRYVGITFESLQKSLDNIY